MLIYLGLGSNDGDRELHLLNGLNFLAEICESIYTATPYASPALHSGDVHYLNSVALVDYPGTAEELNARLKEFEINEGRDAAARKEGRVPIDIDIVVANGNVVRPDDFSRYFFKRGYEELQQLR